MHLCEDADADLSFVGLNADDCFDASVADAILGSGPTYSADNYLRVEASSLSPYWLNRDLCLVLAAKVAAISYTSCVDVDFWPGTMALFHL